MTTTTHYRQGHVFDEQHYSLQYNRFQGLVTLPVDPMNICCKPRSEASSQASEASAYSALGVGKSVVAQLCQASGQQQLVQAVKCAAAELEFHSARPINPESLLQKLNDVHAGIVGLDDSLCSSSDVEECRQWLKQMQGYIMHLTKQMQAAMAESQQSESSSTTSSMDEACGSSNSSIAGSAACDAAWRVLCQDAADVLSRVADDLAAGGVSSSDFDSPRSEHMAVAATLGSSRLVARQSRLSYSKYWSKKIAL